MTAQIEVQEETAMKLRAIAAALQLSLDEYLSRVADLVAPPPRVNGQEQPAGLTPFELVEDLIGSEDSSLSADPASPPPRPPLYYLVAEKLKAGVESPVTLPTTLIDTGPLVALTDKGDPENHRKCTAVFRSFKTPLLTTWPCLTEALYFLGGIRGWPSQAALWRFVERGALFLHNPQAGEWQRVRTLMEQYQDTPMDLADASLVALVEATGLKRILTLDDDFFVYRINGKETFELIPLASS